MRRQTSKRKTGKERKEPMSTVDGLGSIFTDQTTQSASSNTDSLQEVGKDEFLKLLVSQLQNQDPMNPISNEQFITQLATFSSLEQLVSINQAVTQLVENSKSSAGDGSGFYNN
jgi:flagellar hook assembly protein FlgD